MKKKLLPLFLISLVFVSCVRKEKIVFDSSEPLAMAMDVEWAVVSDPYVGFRSSPGFENDVKAHGRMGDVIMVLGKRYYQQDGKNVFWYSFESGWLEENSVRVYDNKLKAENASKELLK